MKRLTLLFCVIQSYLFCYAQERVNDELPKITPIAMITGMTGWQKDDLGQWRSGLNSLANPNNLLQKIELYLVEYKKDTSYCVAKFTKERIYHNGHYLITYDVNYWLVARRSSDTFYSKTAPVQYVYFKILRRNLISTTVPIKLIDISNDIAIQTNTNNLSLVMGKFCIESRKDNKHQKTQFLIGAYDELSGFSDFDDGTDQGNDTLERAYFEVPTSVYEAFVNKLN